MNIADTLGMRSLCDLCQFVSVGPDHILVGIFLFWASGGGIFRPRRDLGLHTCRSCPCLCDRAVLAARPGSRPLLKAMSRTRVSGRGTGASSHFFIRFRLFKINNRFRIEGMLMRRNTVFSQLMQLICQYRFKKCVDRHDGDRYTKCFSCSQQLLVLL